MRTPEAAAERNQARFREITTELIEMGRVDQEMRRAERIDFSIDAAHSARLKKIIEEMGWPLISCVGKDAARAAWLIAQHATRDPAFQKECIALMRALPDGEVEPEHIAYLHDRIQAREFGVQTYGTQAASVRDGKVTLVPIENPDSVDERRRVVGLPPLAEYIGEWEHTLREEGKACS